VLLAWQEAFPVLALLELHFHSSPKQEYVDGLEARWRSLFLQAVVSQLS
jgi:hypothetical protein